MVCDQQRLSSYAQSDQSLSKLLEYSLTVKLLTEQHLEFLSLKGDCTGSSESTHVKMSHCLKLHVMAQINRQLRLVQFVASRKMVKDYDLCIYYYSRLF